jgi:primosomal protein N' (replication factor Y)
MPDVACVAVESAMPSFDRLYSYLIPPAMRGIAKPGCRVRIPFGRANRKMTA